MTKVLILGAGSSHGHGVSNVSRPPLSSQFFCHSLSRKLKQKYALLGRYLLQNADIDIDSEGRTDIEEAFARLEPSWRLGSYDWREIVNRYGPEFVSANPIDMLRSYVTDLIYKSTRWLKNSLCPFHEFMVRSWLQKGDTIISFNYDLIIDMTLKKYRSWNEITGYGFRDAELRRFFDKEKNSDVLLLKPHGSLNWFRATRLLWRSKGADSKDMDFESIPSIRVIPLELALNGKTLQVDEKNAIFGVAIRVLSLFSTVIPEDYLEEGKFDFNVELLGNSLVERDLYQKGYLPLIIMPTPNKPLEEMIFAELSEVWKSVRSALENCDEILSLGFSFRDDHFNQILFEATKSHPAPTKLTVVSRDVDEFDYITNRFRSANIHFEHFDGWFKEYVSTHKKGPTKSLSRRIKPRI